MKAGVSIAPCPVVMRPSRARPSTFSSSKPKPPISGDQHRFAVRVEAIARLDRVAVRAQDGLPSGERRYQDEQARSREMEVGDERVHDPEPMPGSDEEIRGAPARPHPPLRRGRPL